MREGGNEGQGTSIPYRRMRREYQASLESQKAVSS